MEKIGSLLLQWWLTFPSIWGWLSMDQLTMTLCHWHHQWINRAATPGLQPGPRRLRLRRLDDVTLRQPRGFSASTTSRRNLPMEELSWVKNSYTVYIMDSYIRMELESEWNHRSDEQNQEMESQKCVAWQKRHTYHHIILSSSYHHIIISSFPRKLR